MEEVLAEAAKREEGSPSMSPPPVNEKENQYLDMPYEERMKQARFHDYLIMGFVLICFTLSNTYFGLWSLENAHANPCR